MEKSGRKLLREGKFSQAERLFKKALELDDSAPIRNNLALAAYMAGAPGRALRVLEKHVALDRKGTDANPFSHALTAKIYCALDQEDLARRHLTEAIRRFDAEVERLRSFGQTVKSVYEYTVIIMRAAGELKDHTLVFDLYRRWKPYHVNVENKHLAAVACFNMGKFNKAAALWKLLEKESFLFQGMQRVSLLAEQEVVPPFPLGYELYSLKRMEQMTLEAGKDDEKLRLFVQDGLLRMFWLSLALAEVEFKDAITFIEKMIEYGGQWGEELARRMLQSDSFSTPVKMAAARALVARGAHNEDEPISMVIDGKQESVMVRGISLSMENDEELNKVVQHARQLSDEGKIDHAIELLKATYTTQRKTSPDILLLLANLLRAKGELEFSLRIMQMLEEIMPESPVLWYNLSVLMLQMGRLNEAREYFERIDAQELGDEFQDKLKILRREIETAAHSLLGLTLASDLEAFTDLHEEKERLKVEDKSLSVDATLAGGLRNMPAGWLGGACMAYGIEPARRRSEREEQIKRFLLQHDHLPVAFNELSDDEVDLISYLLSKGGWSRVNAVSRKFGSMVGDGFFWEEYDPDSPLGFLWSRCLVMVGKAKINGRRYKIASIPVELRDPLAALINK